MADRRERGHPVVALAERLFALLDEGAFSTTYKHALLLSILELCFEKTSRSGVPPQSLTTRELAEKVVALYWTQCIPWNDGRYLRQSGSGKSGQAEIVTRIIEFRRVHPQDPSEPLHRARLRASAALDALVRFVEWKLIQMPIPRLQRIGTTENRFLYDYEWTEKIPQRQVTAYQRHGAGDFDNTLRLRPGIAEGLVALNNLLRPLVQREWLHRVEAYNAERIPTVHLEQFLFDRQREQLAAARLPLRELQGGRCFYCERRVDARCDVDHFIPWARYPNNAVENLVVACPSCNGSKSDFLASAAHVDRWTHRADRSRSDLERLAKETVLESAPARSHSVAVALYLPLPEDALLWSRVVEPRKADFDRFARVEARIRGALAA